MEKLTSRGKRMLLTFIILIITTILFIQAKFRSDLIAVGSLLALTLTGIITPADALAGFANSVVIMIAGLFIVGAGIFNTGLAEQISRRLLKFGGGHENRLLIIIMLTVAFFSAFMSNTGTVAVMLPIVVSMALSIQSSPSKFLIPLAFASSLGGILTLIGTPPNLVASEGLADQGFKPLHFFGFTPVSVIVLITGIIFMATIGKKLLPNQIENQANKQNSISPNQLAGVYKIYPALHLMRVSSDSKAIDKPLAELQLPTTYDVTLIAIERNGKEPVRFIQNRQHITPKAHTTLKANDLILMLGRIENIQKLAEDYQFEKLTNASEDETRKQFLSRRFGIAELIVRPQSAFHNKTIRELHFRKTYGLTALAIHRHGEYIHLNVGKEKLRPGDAILVHGEWKTIEAFAENTHDVVVVGNIADAATTATASGKAPIAGMIMIFMLLLMVFEVFEPVISVLIAAFLMLITGCLRSIEDAYREINWESVILIAAMLPMATALEKTGGIQFLSDTLITALEDFGPLAIMAGLYILTALLSQFISNTATAVIFVPVAITTAVNMGYSPYPFVIAVAISASMAFSTPIASPTNALVINAGSYKFRDFVKVGVPLQIVLAIVIIAVIPLIYPF